MWKNSERCCFWCKSKAPPAVNTRDEIVHCPDCGGIVGSYLISGLTYTEIDGVTAEPKNYFVPSNTQTNNTSSFSNLLPSNLGNSNPVSIADISDRLGLDVILKNQATEIFNKVDDQIQGRGSKKQNALIAACIYIACRENDMTRSLAEISSVTAEATPGDIYDAVDLIAETLSIEKRKLMDVKPADFTTRFCNALKVDSDTVTIAHQVTKSCDNRVDCNRSPASIAAAIAYRNAQIFYDRKLLKDIVQASGIEESKIVESYDELYPDPSTTEEPAKQKDPKNL